MASVPDEALQKNASSLNPLTRETMHNNEWPWDGQLDRIQGQPLQKLFRLQIPL